MSQHNTQSTGSDERFHPDDEITPYVKVGRESLPIAIKHGMELWWDESTPTKRLDEREDSSQFTRFVNGRIEGKLAEVAFTDVLRNWFDVDSAVDWRIYGDYNTTDNGDLLHVIDDDGTEYSLGVDFDIKKTKPWNSWLAVRSEIYEKIDDDAPVILSKLRIEDDIQLDEWANTDNWDDVDNDPLFRERLLEFADNNFPVGVEFVGSAYPHEFEEHFDKGECLYDPHTGDDLGRLKRPNEGIFVDNLDSTVDRWN